MSTEMVALLSVVVGGRWSMKGMNAPVALVAQIAQLERHPPWFSQFAFHAVRGNMHMKVVWVNAVNALLESTTPVWLTLTALIVLRVKPRVLVLVSVLMQTLPTVPREDMQKL